MTNRERWALLALLGLTLLPSCSGENTAPTAATLTVDLPSSHGDEGAILFTISGGPVDSVEAAGYTLYSARIDPNTRKVVVTGNLSNGALARIRIPDGRQASSYSATVSQVAVRSTYAERDPSSYTLTVAP